MNVDRIFGAFDQLSELTHIADLRRQAAAASIKRCGMCTKWNKSRECPKEHNVGGYSRGPSCDAMPCNSFVMAADAMDLRDRLMAQAEQRLAAIRQAQGTKP